MKHQRDCQSLEILKREANTEQENPARLLVIPEEVENKDTSDGKTEFDEEIMKKYKMSLNTL